MTIYRVVLHAAVPGEIRGLPRRERERVKETIDGLAANPTPPGAMRLKGLAAAWRIRVGDYRIIYEIHATEIAVYVVGVTHRREVYRRVLRRLR